MTVKFVTIGYLGRTIEEFERIVKTDNGMLLDIRYSAKSRKPGFSEKRLKEVFGDDYLWLWEFGNEEYQDGAIQLADPEMGLNIIRNFYEDSVANDWDSPVYLMCACRDYDTCHRRAVAELLREHGYEVTEYSDKTE